MIYSPIPASVYQVPLNLICQIPLNNKTCDDVYSDIKCCYMAIPVLAPA